MDLTNIKKVDYNISVSANSGTSSSQKASSAGNVDIGKFTSLYAKLAQELGISEETLRAIVTANPNFDKLPKEEQLAVVQNYNNSVATQSLTEEAVATEDTELSQSTVDDSQEIQDESTSDTESSGFNHKAYSELSNKEKANVYALELAKNKFIFADKDNAKTAEDWDALPPEQQQKLIDAELKNLLKPDKKNVFKEKDVKTYFELSMQNLQAANYLGISIDEFNKMNVGAQKIALHDYVLDLSGVMGSPNLEEDLSLNQNLSNAQKKYIRFQALLSKAVDSALKKEGDPNVTDGVAYFRDEKEIDDLFNSKFKDTTREEFLYTYLKEKVQNGQKLDESEQIVYEKLGKFVDSEAGKQLFEKIKERKNNPQKQVNYGRLDALKNSSYGELFASGSTADKGMILKGYIRTEFKDMPEKEKAIAINELLDELANDSANAYLVRTVHEELLSEVNSSLKVEMAKQETGLSPELNALNTAAFGEDEKVLTTLAEAQKKFEKTDPERAEALQLTSAELASEKQAAVLSDTYSAAKSEKVQLRIGQRAYSSKDVDVQARIINNAAKNSTENVRADLVKDADKLDDSIELDSMNNLIGQSKVVAKAANESEVITRFAKENQTPAFNSLKTHIENLFPEKEAIEQLNFLTDQIPKCHKDNQLDMHNSAMQSKYSEVQEHAASNISKLDASVQDAALQSVYNSGNEKALEAAVESIKYSPACVKDDVKNSVHSITVQEALLNNSNLLSSEEFAPTSGSSEMSLKAKISKGYALSTEEYASLTPQQKREYFVNYFRQLPIDKKIKLLSSIPDGAQKKSIYTMIARTDSNLFNAIVKDKDRANSLLGMGLPNDVNSQIASVVRFLAISDIGFKTVAEKYEIDLDRDKTNGLKNYATDPYGFDSKEMFKKDKQGHFMA